jgi:putative Mn2+ efflux pump MntP
LSLVTSNLALPLNMVFSHFAAMLLFAFLVSVVFGVLSKDTPREQLIYGAKVFGAFVGIALLLGWIMYPVPW